MFDSEAIIGRIIEKQLADEAVSRDTVLEPRPPAMPPRAANAASRAANAASRQPFIAPATKWGSRPKPAQVGAPRLPQSIASRAAGLLASSRRYDVHSDLLGTATDEGERVGPALKAHLWAAVETGDQPQVQHLLDIGAEVEEKFRGWSPLMKASEEGHVEILQALLKRGAKLEVRNRKGRTALSFAAAPSKPRFSHPDAVRVLLEAGADPGVADRTGRTPRQWALAEQPEMYVETMAVLDEFDSLRPGKSVQRLAPWKRDRPAARVRGSPGPERAQSKSGRGTRRPRRGDARRERKRSRAIQKTDPPRTSRETSTEPTRMRRAKAVATAADHREAGLNIEVMRLHRVAAADQREAELYAAAFPRQAAKMARQVAIPSWQHHPQQPRQPQQQQAPKARPRWTQSQSGRGASRPRRGDARRADARSTT